MKPYVDFDEYLRANNYSRPIYDQEILHRYYAMDKRYITDFLTEVDQFLEKHDVPLYCGEYGVIDCSDLESRPNWPEDVSEYCLARGIGRAIWSYRGMNFTMVDEEGKAIHPGLIKAAAKH